jgi:hypothetical protein
MAALAGSLLSRGTIAISPDCVGPEGMGPEGAVFSAGALGGGLGGVGCVSEGGVGLDLGACDHVREPAQHATHTRIRCSV